MNAITKENYKQVENKEFDGKLSPKEKEFLQKNVTSLNASAGPTKYYRDAFNNATDKQKFKEDFNINDTLAILQGATTKEEMQNRLRNDSEKIGLLQTHLVAEGLLSDPKAIDGILWSKSFSAVTALLQEQDTAIQTQRADIEQQLKQKEVESPRIFDAMVKDVEDAYKGSDYKIDTKNNPSISMKQEVSINTTANSSGKKLISISSGNLNLKDYFTTTSFKFNKTAFDAAMKQKLAEVKNREQVKETAANERTKRLETLEKNKNTTLNIIKSTTYGKDDLGVNMATSTKALNEYNTTHWSKGVDATTLNTRFFANLEGGKLALKDVKLANDDLTFTLHNTKMKITFKDIIDKDNQFNKKSFIEKISPTVQKLMASFIDENVQNMLDQEEIERELTRENNKKATLDTIRQTTYGKADLGIDINKITLLLNTYNNAHLDNQIKPSDMNEKFFVNLNGGKLALTDVNVDPVSNILTFTLYNTKMKIPFGAIADKDNQFNKKSFIEKISPTVQKLMENSTDKIIGNMWKKEKLEAVQKRENNKKEMMEEIGSSTFPVSTDHFLKSTHPMNDEYIEAYRSSYPADGIDKDMLAKNFLNALGGSVHFKDVAIQGSDLNLSLRFEGSSNETFKIPLNNIADTDYNLDKGKFEAEVMAKVNESFNAYIYKVIDKKFNGKKAEQEQRKKEAEEAAKREAARKAAQDKIDYAV